MSKKSQAAVSLIFPAIGAGLVYVSYNDYISVRADNPYAQKNSTLLVTLMIAGLIVLAVGIIMIYHLLRSKQKSTK